MQDAIEGYGEFLDTFPWNVWTTLTFRDYNPTPEASLRAYRRWLRDTSLWLGSCDLYSWVATEYGKLNGRNHLHSLIGGLPEQHSRRSLWYEWFKRYGRAQIVPYERGMGANFYIAKYVTKKLGEWEVIGKWPIRS